MGGLQGKSGDTARTRTMGRPSGVSHSSVRGKDFSGVQVLLGFDLGAEGSDLSDLLEQENIVDSVAIDSDSCNSR